MRGSEHGFTLDEFKSRVWGKGATLILIKTEFNKTCGGFTSLSWNMPNTYIGSF